MCGAQRLLELGTLGGYSTIWLARALPDDGEVVTLEAVAAYAAAARTNDDSPDDRVRGVRSFLEMVAAEPRLHATAVQTVGSKGWDGVALAVVV